MKKDNTMKTKLLTALLTLSATVLMSPMVSAETPQPSKEQIKLAKDKVKYKVFIPKSYVLFEAVEGDLNKDGKADTALIVKATDPSKWVTDENRGKLDRNRRGIIILLNQSTKQKPNQYTKYLQNLNCFSSENENGGIYFPPELWVKIEKGLLNIHYGHGRYGYWDYLFRLQDQDMRLIGYDASSNHGSYIESEVSINFLTGRTIYRKNTNKDWEGDPKFKETVRKYPVKPMYLSKIKDFDEFDFGVPVLNDES